MNISFEYYRIFYVVAKTGNITKAADELMISQPAISKCIKILEEQLGGQLFVRTKRGVVLTEEGKEFYRYIKQAIEYINNAESKFSEMIHLETGTIRIGSSTTLTKKFLIPYLEIFHKRYPHIKIEIETHMSGVLLSRLRQGLLDVVILNLPYHDENDIELIKVKDIHDCFIVGNAYKELVNKKLTLEEIAKYPLVFQAHGSTTRRFLDEFAKTHDIVFKPDLDLAGFTLVTEFTQIGFGIGYATEEYIQDELNSKKLYKLDIVEEIPKREIGIAYSKRNIPSFCTKKLIEIILNKQVF